MTAIRARPYALFKRIPKSRLIPPTVVALFLLAVFSQQPAGNNDKIILSTPSVTTASTASCPPDRIERWPLALRSSESRTFSQTMQDGVLEEIFRKLGTTNKYYVEFGFNGSNYNGSDIGSGSNTKLLNSRGWSGLLMDGGYDNPEINLHKEVISETNIVSLFDKYKVPLEPDYVSIDIDSCDIWVMLELTKKYRPRVMTMEYNRNLPAGSMFAWPKDCISEGWQKDRVMGSSLGTIFAVARDAGYTVVHVIQKTDAFLVRNDVAECLEVLPQWAHESRVLGNPVHKLSANRTRAHIYIDYERYKSSGDMEASKVRSIDLLEYAPMMNPPVTTPNELFYD